LTRERSKSALAAARVHGLQLLGALAADVERQLVGCEKLRPVCFADLARIADVIVVTVRDRDVGYALGCRLERNAGLAEGRAPLQERVDQDDATPRLDPKAGMSEPRDLHCFSLRVLATARRPGCRWRQW
jgi:hypothetical protein